MEGLAVTLLANGMIGGVALWTLREVVKLGKDVSYIRGVLDGKKHGGAPHG